MLNNIQSPDDLKKISQKDLLLLCEEIRNKIISVMARNGGHLASNLGVVELTTALHYVFNTPFDKIIFDVGHQCYTHKLLTGRNKEFDMIRRKGGLSGFPRRKESIYDPVDSGHAATAISSAIGFAVANRLQKKKDNIIVVIGDGAFTGGEAFEGMNFAGNLEIPLIVILNDNDMSIGKNVGAVSNFLNKIAVSNLYQRTIASFDRKLRKASGIIRKILDLLYNIKRGLKYVVEYENIFTCLGFEYIGPIDGHNIKELIYIFEHVKKNIKHPVLLHLKTIKGKGFPMAEGNPSAFHGVTPYLMVSGKIELKEEKTFTEIFAEKILEMGKKHDDVVAVTAAMEAGTGLNLFKLEFPERFFDVGIAEQHAVTFCGALSYAGLRAVLAIYSTFLLRAVDQLSQDVCLSKAPVIFAIDRAEIVGADGETHQGQFDISYLKMLPDITIMAPSDATELKMMFDYAYLINRPVAIRYPKDNAIISQLNNYHPNIEENPFVIMEKGHDLLFIIIGPFVDYARECVEELNKAEIDVGLLYLRILKPLDQEKLLKEILEYKSILVVEESVFSGSVSQELASVIAKNDNNIIFSSINLPDVFIEHDTRKNILASLGFDKEGILMAAYDLLKKVKVDISSS
ncbi:MAG: 1-deoxy-D-xylulose-5-phosphate synthase [Spirochaetes bacterium]|nr:1-deoxy-D-xylulose-5-phosphate synthase [Spirochaetota bacterium]